MKPLYKKAFLLSALLSIILIVAFAGIKMSSKKVTLQAKAVKDTVAYMTIDTALLKLFAQVGKTVDVSAKELSLSGRLSIHDGSDSTLNINGSTYCFIKKGNDFYYRLGSTEMLNADGSYIYADGEQKKIMISAQKNVQPAMMFPAIGKLIEQLKEERYHIIEVPAAAGFRKLSILNPNHISCKEYSTTFDQVTLKPTEVFIRLSNFDDPLNTKKDKTIAMKYTYVADGQETLKLRPEHMVRKTGRHQFVLAEAYKDYELIVTD